MVRNTASAGAVAGTGLIRKPSGERGATYSGDERKSPFRLNVGWNSPAGQPIRSAPLASHLQLGQWCRRETPATCPSAVRIRRAVRRCPRTAAGPDAACRSSDTPRVRVGHPRSGNTLALKSRQRPDTRHRHSGFRPGGQNPGPGRRALVRGRNGSELSSTAAFGSAFMKGSPHGVLCLRDRTARRGIGAA